MYLCSPRRENRNTPLLGLYGDLYLKKTTISKKTLIFRVPQSTVNRGYLRHIVYGVT